MILEHTSKHDIICTAIYKYTVVLILEHGRISKRAYCELQEMRSHPLSYAKESGVFIQRLKMGDLDLFTSLIKSESLTQKPTSTL